jgi:large subunit ribosomal protein L25
MNTTNLMHNLTLHAKSRAELGKKIKVLKVQGFIPAVSYGVGEKSQSLTLDAKEFNKVYREAGESTLISLKVDENRPRKVLVADTQFDPISGLPIHVDLKLIRMDEKIKTQVPLKFVGESKAIIEMDGTLVTNKDEVEIECLPDDLISEIEVDISPLDNFETQIRVSDLAVPENVKILDNPEETVALVQEPRSEEELAELEEKPEEDVEGVEVEEKGKEEEETVEGEGEAGEKPAEGAAEEGGKTAEAGAKEQDQSQKPQENK